MTDNMRHIPERRRMIRVTAADVLAAEEADEREVGRLAIERVLKACMLTFATSYEDAARMAIDKVIAAGFRRTEVPEPSAEPKHDESCAEWCNHCQVCGEGIRFGSRCREHYLNQPQGEPSDAQVEAAARAIYGGDHAWGYVVDYGQGEVGAHWEDLGQELQDDFCNRARAALRAAGEVR